MLILMQCLCLQAAAPAQVAIANPPGWSRPESLQELNLGV